MKSYRTVFPVFGRLILMALCCSLVYSMSFAPSARATRAGAAARFTFARGVVVNHWIGAVAPDYPGQSGVAHTYAASWFDQEDVKWIAAHGFDHIQMSIAFSQWLKADGSLDEEKIAPFERLLRWTEKAGIGVVARFAENTPPPGMANEQRLNFDDERVRAHYASLWERVARRLANEGDHLRFMLPRATAGAHLTQAHLNEVIRLTVTGIRTSSPRRFIYVSPVVRRNNSISADEGANFEHLPALRLPDDARIGVAISYRHPEVFVYQDSRDKERIAVPFPGRVPDVRNRVAKDDLLYAASNRLLTVADLRADFEPVARWKRGAGKGREIYLGDFGVHDGADPASTLRYLEAMTSIAARLRLGWAIYDYESGAAVRGADGAATVRYKGLKLRSGVK